MLERLFGRFRSNRGPAAEAEALKNRGNRFLSEGDIGRAEACYREAIAADPGYAHAYNNLGSVLMRQRRLAEARSYLEQAIRIDPKLANAYYNLYAVLREQGELATATGYLRRTLELDPAFEPACLDLAHLHLQQADPDGSRRVILGGIKHNPQAPVFHFFLGDLHRMDGDPEGAVEHYRRALALKPDYADVLNNLGIALRELGRLDEAVDCYRRALDLKPDCAEWHFNLGNTLKFQDRLDEAVASYRKALHLKPDFADGHYNLANALQVRGNLDEAAAAYRRALELKPSFIDAHSNLIFTLDLMAGEDTASLQAERRKWDETHAAHLLPDAPHTNDPAPDRRLRIGYVSADFREHSAARVFWPMLTRFDPEQFEVFAYSNSKIEDSITQLFRESVSRWRNIVGVSDDGVADMIREDSIDILVDLSGHSGGNRLPVFARKPAPIQVTAWGYAASTGLRAMDAFFADSVVVPPDERHYFVEQIRYLPNVMGYFRPESYPEIDELPALSSASITFASFNRMAKVSDGALDAWASVLQAVTGSRMVLKAVELDDLATRARVTEYFAQSGIDAERIVLLGKSSWLEHTAAFNRADITLDPFPHGGGVSTLDSLIMGVPVITLRWPTVVGRLSASILTTMGLTDWIAETPEQYVDLAVRKAQDLAALAQLRQQLRTRFYSSAIGDAPAYAQAVEKEYRQLWREWCARQGTTGESPHVAAHP